MLYSDRYIFDNGILYSREHVWIRMEEKKAVMGISEYARVVHDEILCVELPEPEEHLKKNCIFGMVTSLKTSSVLHMPISGTILAVNTTLEKAPEKVISRPFTEGWMIYIDPDDITEFKDLLCADNYKYLLSSGNESLA